MTGLTQGNPKRLAFLVRDLGSGGAQRTQMRLAGALAARGLSVDLVVCSARLTGVGTAPPRVRVVNLRPGARLLARIAPFLADPSGLSRLAPVLLTEIRPSPTLPYLPSLVRYLRRERPAAVVAASTALNLEAIWAHRLARTDARMVVVERTFLSVSLAKRTKRRRHRLPLIARYYPEAAGIVAISHGVADDLAAQAAVERRLIEVIYNPVFDQEPAVLAHEPLAHPWFQPGMPPVVLGAGRLTEQKDFPTLIHAFALLRAQRELRLVILGGGHGGAQTASRIAELKTLARSLGVEADLDLPGPEANPYRFMARAGLFALSSAWEGFGSILVEAMACGCPVVSTDCPSGPAEILEQGRWGPLVRVGDAHGLAAAIGRTLDRPPPRADLIARAADFSLDRVVDAYLRVLLPAPAS